MDEKYNEIRLDEKGELDDIVIKCIHLEDMDGKNWWLAIYDGNKRTTFWIRSKSKIKVFLNENELKSKIKKFELKNLPG